MSHQDLLAAMTNRDADPVNVEPSFAGQICCISTHLPNRVLFLNCPGQLYSFLHSAIRTGYRLGIQKEQGQQALTLNGMPFLAPGPGEIFGPQIHCAIIRCMINCGWELVCGSSISLRVTDVHSMFFQKAPMTNDTATAEVCALSFVEHNTVRLIDAPVELVELMKMILESHWLRGEKGAVKFSVQNGVPQFIMKGRLFDGAANVDLLATRALLAQVISKIKIEGYNIITACPTRVTNAGMRPQELDTWIIGCPKSRGVTETRDKPREVQEVFRD
ncbi:Putative uncharacterized protein [Taphrina deformans PYCC 5710]|uniref:Uncharacterized protein n=1 Tax=Taphrina deformans (strain PYCC 5710 / ATCC 11124 / CBS 356.35 / IMI 108563 / JCM 9778 / NBRC 8474) TaxID=1097556 RepID=R4XGX5_TAPDE|nr:Putative uncharacterized protein [Taphrina deformans PYCC 5710]|eukprot:CCG85138.1 Putative uncharacterized protein [Taphrina deformans PYCC 5710]